MVVAKFSMSNCYFEKQLLSRYYIFGDVCECDAFTQKVKQSESAELS